MRIGGGLGFYGDSYQPTIDLIARGDVQYVGFDHLSELTLAILAKDKARNPALGYARDLGAILRELLPRALPRHVRLVSNGGGLNPLGAARVAAEVAADLGLNLTIGVVLGDDVSSGVDAVVWEQASMAGAMAFANAYLGALPIKQALQQGADLVLTGRVADSALFLGALAHAWDWSLPGESAAGPPDWNLLAAGAVAGHLLECSGQVTGGNHSGDWAALAGDLDRIGYPIAEVTPAGALLITKTPASGGRVTFDTVREQILYEVHDPARYYTPDVTVDLSQVSLHAAGVDRVVVDGVRGTAPLATYKVVAGYEDGFLGQGLVGFSWPDALPKARAAEQILRRQVAARGWADVELNAEYLGVNAFHGSLGGADAVGTEPNEVYLRMVLRTGDRGSAEAFARLFPPLALSGPPTASGFIGVDRVRQLFRARTGAIAHASVDAGVRVRVASAAAFRRDEAGA